MYGVATEKGATSYNAQCGEYQQQDICVPKGRDNENELIEPI